MMQPLILIGLSQKDKGKYFSEAEKARCYEEGVKRVMKVMGLGDLSEGSAVKRLIASGLFQKPDEAKDCLDYLVANNVEADMPSLWDSLTFRESAMQGVTRVNTIEGLPGYRFYKYTTSGMSCADP